MSHAIAPSADDPQPKNTGLASVLPDYVVRARVLTEHAIERRWSEGLLNKDPDGVFTSFLGAEHVEKLVRLPTAVGARISEHSYDTASPFGGFAVTQALTPSEADLFALLLACEIDPVVTRLLTYLGGNQAQFVLSIDLVFEVVYRGRQAFYERAVALMHHDLSPHGRLRRLRMITVDGADTLPALGQTIRLASRMLPWLLGERVLDAALAACAELEPPAAPVGRCDAASLAAVVEAFAAGRRLVRLDGVAHSGRAMLLRFAAAKLGRPLLFVGRRTLTAAELVDGFREATLHGAVLALRVGELDGAAFARLRECLDVYPATVAIYGGERDDGELATLRPVTHVGLAAPPIGEREALWRRFLGHDCALADDELRGVASLYNIGVAGIVSVCRSANLLARAQGGAVERAHLGRAMRQLFHSDLATVATRVEVTQTWDDLVLPQEVGDSIVAIIDRVRYRSDVLGNWGFARKLGKGLGTTVLFSGEPGTGKSMVAGLIANELGLDLYVINLSRLMSKWIGETEKNLARAFDAAEAGHVMLLFDEADTILGRRTAQVRSSNDRYANLETNFVLARLEQFHGVAIFTTNLATSVDPAMERRMSVHVHFPFPDEVSRAEMWRRMIPAEASVADDVDFDWLASRYQLSGGFIRNVILRAAFIAARCGEPLRMDHLVEAAELEYQERGALIAGGRLA
jgi:AAA+ superfamily predicted ATPase